MHNKQHSAALWIVIAVLGCGLAFVALAGQIVSAQSLEPELKPPFRFAERPAAPEVQAPPPGSTTVMTETFGASFDPITSTSGITPTWRVITNPGDTAGYYWDKVGAGTPALFLNSAWSAADPRVLTPGVSPYPAGQDSWLIYGPINLSRFMYVHLSFEYYLDSRAGDTLLWGYSTDGQTFYGNSQSGPLGQWITDAFSFRANSTFQTVYLAFAFDSQSNPQGKGAFVRNVTLTGEPWKMVHLPLVMNNYSPPPLFGPYTFNTGTTTDINHWGGEYNNPGSTKYGQCVPGQCTIHTTTSRGNPASSLRLYTNGTYSFIATSPNDIAPNDYDLYVDISPFVIYPRWSGCEPYCPGDDLGDWYGIIFNAKSDATTFGANPSGFHYNTKYYRLYFYNIDSIRPIALALDRCDGSADPGNNTCYRLATSSPPGNFIGGASGFDRVHVKRLASGAIQVWVNDTLLISVTDATYTGSAFGKYGAFIYSSTYNDTNYPSGNEMQVDFDNIKVYRR